MEACVALHQADELQGIISEIKVGFTYMHLMTVNKLYFK